MYKYFKNAKNRRLYNIGWRAFLAYTLYTLRAVNLLTGIKADGKTDLMERKTCNMIEAMEVRNLNIIVVVSLTVRNNFLARLFSVRSLADS